MPWRLRLLHVCLAFCAFVSAATCASAAEPLPPAVTRMLRASGLALASFGIDVRPIDVGTTAPWFSLNAEQPFLMASTTKIVTSLAALDLLGEDRRWPTEAHATGPLKEGRLAGDLVIVGGDLGLTISELQRWFRQMRSEGLDEIAGNIVLSRVALLHEADPAQAAETAKELQPDAAPEAQRYNTGKLLVSVQPGRGSHASVIVRPRPANVVIDNDVLMGDGACSAWARWKSPREAAGGTALQLWVRGRWSRACPREDIAFVAPPEQLRLAPALRIGPILPIAAPRLVAKLWAEAGGHLRGHVVETGARARAAPAGRWSSRISTPLAEVMREMNKTSNNAAAHELLLALASGPETVSAQRSAQARVAAWLRTQGLADGDIRVVEGSGRSHEERARPRALVHLLCNAWRGLGSQAFVDSLPIAGIDGTLVHRMRGSAAEGQAWLKTGTLANTRALAGYVRGRSGKIYAVTAIVTDAHAARASPTLDKLIEWIAKEG